LLKELAPRQHTLEMVIEDLVPTDHLLRKIDKHINFEFIRNKVRHFHCDNKAPLFRAGFVSGLKRSVERFFHFLLDDFFNAGIV
jgi:hypothetical protein